MDLVLRQATPWGFVWPIEDGDGQPVDLTGWDVVGQVRNRAGVLLHQWSAGIGNVGHPDYPPGEGWAAIVVPWETSAAWSWVDETHWYEVRVRDLHGAPFYVDSGTFYVQASTWRAEQ